MIRRAFRLHRLCPGVVLYILLSIWALPAVYGAAVESLDELHQKAKKEGGKLTIYAALSARSMEVILPAFMKRFPGVTIDHIDATADKLLARIVRRSPMLTIDDIKEFPKYEKLWKDIFQIR